MSKTNKSLDLTKIQDAVSGNLNRLTMSALIEAIGAPTLFKVEFSDTGKTKYFPVSDEEEMVRGLEYIAENGNQNEGEGYYILQQRPPNHKFWNALMERYLGKTVENNELNSEDKLDLITIGEKALQRKEEKEQIGNHKLTKRELPPGW